MVTVRLLVEAVVLEAAEQGPLLAQAQREPRISVEAVAVVTVLLATWAVLAVPVS